MWFMPSYGRPEALARMEQAPGGLPRTVCVLVNEDDPKHMDYRHYADTRPLRTWQIISIPRGSRCSDAHRLITKLWPHEPFYGLLCDDQWPVTPGWHEALVEAAGTHCISTPAGEPSFPLLRNALVLGGDLVRAMGTLVPAPVKHNYEDNIWDQIAADFHLLQPCPEVIVEHRHWTRGDAPKDATYQRGSADIDEDRKIFESWLRSADRIKMSGRIGKLVGASAVTTLDPKTVRLAILVPIGDEVVDKAYHTSIFNTGIELKNQGFNLNIIESTGGSHVGKARERVLWKAMKNKPTHLMWIDSDMGWQPRQIARLIASDHEFCAIPGARKTDELRLCFNPLPTQQLHPVTRFLKVRDVGFAFVLMKVSVIEKMCAAYPELEYNAGPEQRQWALFLDMIDNRRERLSEDFSFCERWRGIGGEIWLDPDASIIHAGRKEYTGKVSDHYDKPALAAAE